MTVYRCGGVNPHQIKETVERVLRDFPKGLVIDGNVPSINAHRQPIVFMYFLGFDIQAYFNRPGINKGPTGVVTKGEHLEAIKSAYSAKYLEYLESHCRIYSAFTNWGELE